MRILRFSIAGMSFAIAIAAINLTLFQSQLEWAGTLYDNEVGPPELSSLCRYLLPAIDVLAIAGFRFRIRERRTAGSLGFILTGSLSLILSLIWIRFLSRISDSILSIPLFEHLSIALSYILSLILGDEGSSSPISVWTMLTVFGVLLPALLYSTPTIIAAVLGRSVMQRLANRPGNPTRDGEGSELIGVTSP